MPPARSAPLSLPRARGDGCSARTAFRPNRTAPPLTAPRYCNAPRSRACCRTPLATSFPYRLMGLCRASFRVGFQPPLRNVRLGALVEARCDAGRDPGVLCLGCFMKTRRHLSPPQNRCEASCTSAPQVSHLAIAYPPKPMWCPVSRRLLRQGFQEHRAERRPLAYGADARGPLKVARDAAHQVDACGRRSLTADGHDEVDCLLAVR